MHRYARLSEAGDPLEKLNALVPWHVRRKPLKRSQSAFPGHNLRQRAGIAADVHLDHTIRSVPVRERP